MMDQVEPITALDVRAAVLAHLEGGDLSSAAASLLPYVEGSAGAELDSDLEFALCAVFSAYALCHRAASR